MVPWQLTQRPGLGKSVAPPKRRVVYKRDPYWFNSVSTTHGPDNLAVGIPPTGPGSAGATFPTNKPEVEEIILLEQGGPDTVYGANTAFPLEAGRSFPGGI